MTRVIIWGLVAYLFMCALGSQARAGTGDDERELCSNVAIMAGNMHDRASVHSSYSAYIAEVDELLNQTKADPAILSMIRQTAQVVWDFRAMSKADVIFRTEQGCKEGLGY